MAQSEKEKDGQGLCRAEEKSWAGQNDGGGLRGGRFELENLGGASESASCESEVTRMIKFQFGDSVSTQELFAVAEFLALVTGLDPPRDAEQSHNELHRWFCDHWGRLEPEIRRVSLCTEDKRNIKDVADW
jgi:hypothetical protein